MSTYVPIQAITLTANATEVNFTNIPQTYTDLILVISARGSSTTFFNDNISVRFNADSNSLYSFTRITGNGSTATSARGSGTGSFIGQIPNSTSGTSTNDRSVNILQVFNYANTVINKTFISRSSAIATGSSGTNSAEAYVGVYRATNAITSLTIIEGEGQFLSGTIFTLYGIGSGAPKAFGGNEVRTDGAYWYHVYRSSGRFEPTQTLSCDVLVIAGGGGASALSGGGGAGGLLIHSSQSVNAQNYTVTVGAGGVATDNRNAVGGNGSNSQFGSLTASVGGGGGGGDQNAGSTLPGGNGGSGGGGGRANVGGTGTSGQGYNGGNGFSAAFYGGGGGGGAGAAGANAVSNNGGNGGVGFYNSVTNAMGLATSTGELSGGNYYYAGGGGGGSNNGVNSTGGLGGGGNSTGNTNAQTTAGIAGDANTGGGGGGNNAVGTGQFGGNGGSGIIILRYPV